VLVWNLSESAAEVTLRHAGRDIPVRLAALDSEFVAL